MRVTKLFFTVVGSWDLEPEFCPVIGDLGSEIAITHHQLWQKCHKIVEKISPCREHHPHVHRNLVVYHINLF